MKQACAIFLISLLLALPALSEPLRPQGSAGLLTESNLLVSIYIQDANYPWSSAAMEYTCRALEEAVAYICRSGTECGRTVTLITAAEYPELRYELYYPISSLGSLSDLCDQFDSDVPAILESIPCESLLEKYNADGVGFLFFFPCDGISYTLSYYDGDPPEYYLEYCVIYAYDLDTPGEYEAIATYAHEILHLFGALDLYTPCMTDGVTHALVEYVDQNLPDELMYYTYEPDDSSNTSSITRELSDITLYLVGLIDDTEYLELFPSLRRQVPAAFFVSDYGSEKDYACDRLGCPFCNP